MGKSDLKFKIESEILLKSVRGGWVGYFDGACDLNPGPMGIGALLLNDGILIDSVSHSPGLGTNNIAEYRALIALLNLGLKHQVEDLIVCGDSMLVLLQAQNRWRVKHSNLKPLHADALILISRFKRIQWAWIPREENERADALSKACL